MQVAGVRDAVTKFTVTVALTLDLGAPASASVTESTIGVPEALTATCSGNCKLGALLDAVVAAIKEIVGWQTGTETVEAWNEKIALLLAGCPYEGEFEKMIRDALAAGQPITLERRNVKRTSTSRSRACCSTARSWRRPVSGATRATPSSRSTASSATGSR